MNLKNLLLSVAAIAATPLFAATYYVTPEGAGSKNGSSWENAFDTEGFREQALKNADGDVYELAAGTYSLQQAIVIKKGTYATINGATGTARTILDGSNLEAKINDKVDIAALIKIQTVSKHGDKTKHAQINDIDFTSLTTNISDDPTDDSVQDYGISGAGALFIYNSGYVTIKSCRFYGNKAEGKLGGAAAHPRTSQVKFIDCNFYENEAKTRGGAVRISTSDSNKGIVSFENCVFKNNTTSENLGIIFAGYSKQITFLNSIVAENKSNGTTNAAAIFINPKGTFANQLTIINSTIAGNTPSQIGFNGKGANLRIVNSVITGAEGTNAIDFNADEDFANVMSGGYNYVGPISVGEFWQDTDNHGTENTYASIFGENTINSDNQLVPVKYVAGASGEQVKTATTDWGLPAGLSLATDAAGNTRVAGMTPGANSYTEQQIKDFTTSVINVIDDAANAPRLVKVANGVYTVEGATEGVTVYTVNGATVAATSGNTIDLSSFANGLYIIKSGNAIFKVMK